MDRKITLRRLAAASSMLTTGVCGCNEFRIWLRPAKNSSMNKLRDQCVAARRAVAAVEFAISLTVLMLFVFVGFEFFRASMLRHNADCAAYEAARRAIVLGASNANAVAMANDYLARVGVTPTAVTVSPNPIDENTTQINVEVKVAMNNNSWVVPSFMNGKVIVGRSRLMTERAPINLVGALPVPPPPPPPPPPPIPML